MLYRPVFSSSVFGVCGLLIMVINFSNTCGINWLVSAPNCMANSPIAQVALLQTDITSGFKFWPRIGKKLPRDGMD